MFPQTDYVFIPRPFNKTALWNTVRDDQWNDPSWQLANSIRDVTQLAKTIGLSKHQQSAIKTTLGKLKARSRKSLSITPYYACLMAQNPFNPSYTDGEQLTGKLDPIFWQSVPTPAHLMFAQTVCENFDPSRLEGLGTFYQDSLCCGTLWVTKSSNRPGFCRSGPWITLFDAVSGPTPEDINRGLFFISRNQNISEIMVVAEELCGTGIDRLLNVIEKLCTIDHVRCIAICTSDIVVLPMVLDDELLERIDRAAKGQDRKRIKNIYFLTCVNHYHEITPDFINCVHRIKQHGYSVRFQTLLLNHVNADFFSLATIFSRLGCAGLEPWCLRQWRGGQESIRFDAPRTWGPFFLRHLNGWISSMSIPVFNDDIIETGSEKFLSKLSIMTGCNETGEGYREEYDDLERVTQNEYAAAQKTMDGFIGQTGIFRPAVVFVDKDQKPTGVTGVRLAKLTTSIKTKLLGCSETDALFFEKPAARFLECQRL